MPQRPHTILKCFIPKWEGYETAKKWTSAAPYGQLKSQGNAEGGLKTSPTSLASSDSYQDEDEHADGCTCIRFLLTAHVSAESY